MSIKALEITCDWAMRIVMALLALLIIACASSAYAESSATSVTIPWGDWLSAAIVQVILPILGLAIAAFVTWAVRFLPASLKAYVTSQNTAAAEQLLSRAVGYALNKAALDAQGKAIVVPTGNAQVAVALNYAVTHGAPDLVDWLGGPTGIQQKIIARLPATAVSAAPPPQAVADKAS